MRSSPELLIQPYLARGERLLWTGRPRRAIAVQTGDYVGFGMALFGAAFMGREIVQVITDGAYGILPFLVPFAIVWIGIAAGQPLRRARRRRNAVYGLTDRRAIILQEASSEVQSVALVAEPIVALQTHRNGTGTILFGNQSRPFLHFNFQALLGAPGGVQDLLGDHFVVK